MQIRWKTLSLADRCLIVIVAGIACLSVLILAGPVVVVLLTSFTTSPSLRFPPPSLSFQSYIELLDPERSSHIHSAAYNSLKVAAVATVIAVILAVTSALAIARSQTRAGRVLDTVFISPLILPMIAYGLATLVFFSELGFRPSLAILVIGHVMVIVPFVLRTTGASLSQLDRALLESSRSLGAGPWFTFRKITLPLIAPGIAAGAFLAFVFSFDNVPVSMFLSSAEVNMLPIRMWGMIEATLDVRVAAVSGLLIAVIFGALLLLENAIGITRRIGGK